MNTAEIQQLFECELDTASLRIKTEVSPREVTTFGLGSSVPLLVEPLTLKALRDLLVLLSNRSLSWRVIGAGSNILLSDAGLDSVLIRLGREFSQICFLKPDEVITDQAIERYIDIPHAAFASPPLIKQPFPGLVNILVFGACSLMGLSRKASNLGLSGLEFAAGIPASVGGACVMNAGAHGSCMADVVQELIVLGSLGEMERIAREKLGYSYRRCGISKDSIVIAAVLSLQESDVTQVMQRRSSCLEYRKRTQPLHLPSAGSVFRNPDLQSSHTLKEVPFPLAHRGDSLNYGAVLAAAENLIEQVSAGNILEKLGLKGRFQGGVSFSDLHANWLVKISDQARASDALFLIDLAQKKAFDTFGIQLEMEIVCW